MSLPLLPPTNDNHFILSGDVTLHPGTAIAPGVVLQADPGSRIIIEAGVCIGMGSVLHAYQGTVHLEQGSILGLQVLVVGAGRVGQNACLGSGVTIFACDVAAGAMIPAGTLLGKMGRQAVAQSANGTSPFASSSGTASPQAVGQTVSQVVEQIVEQTVSETQFSSVTLTDRELSADPWEDESSVSEGSLGSNHSSTGFTPPKPSSEPSKSNASENGVTGGDRSNDHSNASSLMSQPTQTPVYGQASLDRLMGMLFPHRQALQLDSDEPNAPDS